MPSHIFEPTPVSCHNDCHQTQPSPVLTIPYSQINGAGGELFYCEEDQRTSHETHQTNSKCMWCALKNLVENLGEYCLVDRNGEIAKEEEESCWNGRRNDWM